MTRAPRFLITRAEPDASRSAEAVIARGGLAVIAPLREVVAVQSAVPARPDHLIATSANAFRLGPPLPPDWRDLHQLVVGERTERASRDAGQTGVTKIFPDVERLITSFATTDAPDNPLYLAGEPRKPDLEAWFAQQKRDLPVWLRYAMRDCERLPTTALEALEAGGVDCVLHYSAESARSFVELVQAEGLVKAAASAIHACLSPAVAAVISAADDDKARIVIAHQPRGAALLDAAFTALSLSMPNSRDHPSPR